MNVVCLNAIKFSVEFIKLFLVAVVLLNIRQRKSIYVSFLVALFAFMFGSLFINFALFSFIYGVIAIILLAVNAYEKKKAGIIALSYIGIGIVDVIFATFCILIFHLDADKIDGNVLLDIGLNLFSLVLLLLISFIFYKKRIRHKQLHIRKYIVIYLIGGTSLTLYLTALQFMGMGEDNSVYRNGLVIGTSLSSLVLVVLCVLLIINSNQNAYLKREAEMNANMLEAQKNYYTMLLKKENETTAFRHDIKQHLYCMHNLYSNKKYDELGKYLVDMNGRMEELAPKIQTGNSLITAIVNDISKKFPEVQLQWTGMLPEELHISSLDICTVFYNLISNAFEAVQGQDEPKVDVTVKFMESAMMVTIKNPVRENPLLVNGDFITSKTEDGHGYGIKNVKKCIEKNQGMYDTTCDNGIFVTEIIIPNVL